MKMIMSVLVLVFTSSFAFSQTKPRYVKPIYSEWTVYSTEGHLLGIVRGWNPCRFYRLDSSFWKYVGQGTMDILCDTAKLMYHIRERKYQNIIISDTTFLPFDEYAPLKLRIKKSNISF